MSIKILERVWSHSKQKGSALLVMLALADNADEEHASCYPAIKTIARKARLSEREVQYTLRFLAKIGELKIEHGAGLAPSAGGTQKTNRYTILLPEDVAIRQQTPQEGDARPAPPSRDGVQPTAPVGAEGGAKIRQGGAIALAPEPSVEPREKELTTAPPMPSAPTVPPVSNGPLGGKRSEPFYHQPGPKDHGQAYPSATFTRDMLASRQAAWDVGSSFEVAVWQQRWVS